MAWPGALTPFCRQADDPRLQRLKQSQDAAAFEGRPRHREVAAPQVVSRRRHASPSDSEPELEAVKEDEDADESSDTEIEGDVAHDEAPDSEEEEEIAAKRAAVRER